MARQQRTQETRARIIATAERLMAQRGIDGVSLNEINRAAGQRNTSALHYHFGNKLGLIQAIFDKHTPGIEVRRRELLDATIQNGGSLHGLIRALVLPIAEKLDDKDGGPCYIQFAAQLLSNPDFFTGKLDQRKNPTVEELMRLTEAKLKGLPAKVRTARIEIEVNVLFYSLANYSRRRGKNAKRPQQNKELIINNLIDSIVAVLRAPIGRETKRALSSAPSDRSRARS